MLLDHLQGTRWNEDRDGGFQVWHEYPGARNDVSLGRVGKRLFTRWLETEDEAQFLQLAGEWVADRRRAKLKPGSPGQ
jgi:hypothetical protein